MMPENNMETIRLAPDPQCAATQIVTLARPQVHNAMNTQMWHELWDVLRDLAYRDEVRCLVFTGAGERAFSAGGDLKERNGMSDEAWALQHQLIEDVLLALREFPWPTVAATQGIAFGGGFELALMCDFIIADATARYALPESKLGILPGGGGLQNLARAAGMRRAKQMLYTGAELPVSTAHDWGVVNEVTPAGGALPRALELARQIAAGAPLSLRWAKTTVQQGGGMEFRGAYALDIAAHNLLVRTEDRREGVRAFNEKRAARWSGR